MARKAVFLFDSAPYSHLECGEYLKTRVWVRDKISPAPLFVMKKGLEAKC